MSDQFYPQFTAWGTIKKSLTVMMDEYRFFGMLLIAYVLFSTVPYIYLFDGIDLTNPEVMLEYLSGSHPYLAGLTVFFYFLYAYVYILVLDRTNASLNGYSFHDYPYISRAVKTIIPVIFLYISIAILVGVGLILLIIPGLIAAAGLYLVIPAKLAENLSVSDAIPRGWNLSKGHRLGIWGVILIPFIPVLVLMFLTMGYFAGVLAGIETAEDINRIFSPTYLILNALFNGFLTFFYVVASGVSYHLIAKEAANEDIH